MEDVKVPKKYLVGEEGRGFFYLMQGFDYARAIIALVCCGASMRAMEIAMDYIKQRKAFGTPLAKFEGVQFPLAENWSQMEAIRLLSLKALWMYNREQNEGKAERFETSKCIAEAKLLAPIMAFKAINEAMQWFGAFGYTTECPLDMALKGVRSYQWAEGASEVLKMIVARELLGKEFVATK